MMTTQYRVFKEVILSGLNSFLSVGQTGPTLTASGRLCAQFFSPGPHFEGPRFHPHSYLGSFSLGISSPACLQNGTESNSGPTQPRLHLQEKAQSDAL